ncbi:MAG: bifunctional pyr operon transcriptional regulator/uracil phosphoribosyltransferase PyrR [Bacteroidia bacterium]|nr:bifunctional pyr operon transcriptional regulator/uracil phosphoribosyltransferase PyrR [Bacteroidia bacterium]
MKPRLLLDNEAFSITIQRLCCQLMENHDDFTSSAILGIQPRGIYLAQRISEQLKQLAGVKNIQYGNLDVTFFRDDFGRREELLVPNPTEVEFLIENKKVILVDDVLYTGRTIRAALDAMLSFGRPKKVELMVLIDRRYRRHLPIEPDYVGKRVDTISSEKVKVDWKEINGNKDEVWLIEKDKTD